MTDNVIFITGIIIGYIVGILVYHFSTKLDAKVKHDE